MTNSEKHYESMPDDTPEVFGWKDGMGFVSPDLIYERLEIISNLDKKSDGWYEFANSAFKWLSDCRQIRTELLSRGEKGILNFEDYKIVNERMASDFFGNVLNIELLKNTPRAGDTAREIWEDFQGVETKRYGADAALLKQHLDTLHTVFKSRASGIDYDFGFWQLFTKTIQDFSDPDFKEEQVIILSMMSMGLVFGYPLAMLAADTCANSARLASDPEDMKKLKLDFMRQNVMLAAPSGKRRNEMGSDHSSESYAYVNTPGISWSEYQPTFIVLDDFIDTGASPENALYQFLLNYGDELDPERFNTAMGRTLIFSGIDQIPLVSSEKEFVWERSVPSDLSSKPRKTSIRIPKK